MVKRITSEALSTSELEVLSALIARGDTNEVIIPYVQENFGKILISSDMQDLRFSLRNKVAVLKKEIERATSVDISTLLNKVNSLIERKLNRAIKDSEAEERLDSLLAKGEIDQKQYNKQVASLKPMSINDMIKIAQHLTPKQPIPIALTVPQSHQQQYTPQMQARFEQALQSGDPIALQEIMLPSKG